MLLITQVTDTTALLSNQRPNGDSVHAVTKLSQCRLLGNCGGKCLVSASVDRLVTSIHSSGVAMISAVGISTRCQPDGRRLRRMTGRSTALIERPRQRLGRDRSAAGSL